MYMYIYIVKMLNKCSINRIICKSCLPVVQSAVDTPEAFTQVIYPSECLINYMTMI